MKLIFRFISVLFLIFINTTIFAGQSSSLNFPRYKQINYEFQIINPTQSYKTYELHFSGYEYASRFVTEPQYITELSGVFETDQTIKSKGKIELDILANYIYIPHGQIIYLKDGEVTWDDISGSRSCKAISTDHLEKIVIKIHDGRSRYFTCEPSYRT